jgi:hypothetical protein
LSGLSSDKDAPTLPFGESLSFNSNSQEEKFFALLRMTLDEVVILKAVKDLESRTAGVHTSGAQVDIPDAIS